jgi:hypothetical protein
LQLSEFTINVFRFAICDVLERVALRIFGVGGPENVNRERKIEHLGGFALIIR